MSVHLKEEDVVGEGVEVVERAEVAEVVEAEVETVKEKDDRRHQLAEI